MIVTLIPSTWRWGCKEARNGYSIIGCGEKQVLKERLRILPGEARVSILIFALDELHDQLFGRVGCVY